jgi:hypothetical protein
MAFFYSPKIITDGLVFAVDAANKKSYPGSGTTWTDLSGNGNHIDLYNEPIFENNTLAGDGVNVYGRTQNTLDLSSYNAITVVCSFQCITTQSIGMLYEHTSNWNQVNSSYGGFGLYTNAQGSGLVKGYHHVQLRGNSSYAGRNVYAPNNDIMTIYTTLHDFTQEGGNETSIYLNGALETATGGSSYNANNTNNFGNDYFYLWSRGGLSSYSNTRINFLQIYNRALTPVEISQNYNALKGRFGL